MKRILLVMLATIASVSAFANHILDFDVNSGNTGINGNQTVGWQFDVNTQIIVTHLSWYDHGQDGIDEHEVGLWDTGGNLLVSAVLGSGTSEALDGIWRTVDVADTILTVGSGYIVGGYNGATSTDVLKANVSQTVASEITFVDATFSNFGATLDRPTIFSVASSGFYGPSFQYQAVPEPATMVALGLGAAALLRRRRKA